MAPHSQKKEAEKIQSITINGLVSTIEYQKVKCCAGDLNKKFPNVFTTPVLNGMLEFEWSLWLDAKKLEHKGEVWAFSDPVMVFVDNQYIGSSKDFIKWATDNYNFEDFRNDTLYETLRKEAYAKHLDKTKDDYVYIDFESENQSLGRLVLELFKNIVPKTCENFRLLCTGEKGRLPDTLTNLSYKNTIISRIVPNGWVQGGDIISGKGNTSESVYGGFFDDESFAVKHDKRGILGMANQGRHTNGSQFYVTFQPAPFMDKKYVAFGQVVEGSETLKKLESINTQNQRPVKEVKIVDCGVYKFNF